MSPVHMVRSLDRPVRGLCRQFVSRVGMAAGAVLVGVFFWGHVAALAADNEAGLDTLSAARESITVDDLRLHVNALADDSFEGREAGSRGGRASGVYLVKQLERFGLSGGAGRGGFYQTFGNGYRNILALVPGSDPQLKDEVVVVGAHYDHVGYGTQSNSYGPTGYIHNGADDNASGTSGLLELAQALSMLPQAPRRTILLAFWDGEEKGLLGSKHWTRDPTVPLNRVVAMINMDMIGRLRNNRLEVYGWRTIPGMRELISRQNHDAVMQLDFLWEMKSNSDHYSFFDAGVPAVMLHTGLHDEYHTPRDDAHRTNVDGMRLVSRLLLDLVVAVADAPQLGKFRSAARYESPGQRREYERPLAELPPRLGLQWDGQRAEKEGIFVTRVVPGSAADRAGVKTGDQIIEFAGENYEMAGEQVGSQFHTHVLAAANPVKMIVRRTGEEEPRELTVNLDGSPMRVGITWRTHLVEPGVAMLSRVVWGSAAHVAGLRAGDRVYELDGQRLASSEEFLSQLSRIEGLHEMLVERDGVLRVVQLDIPPLPEEEPPTTAGE